MPRIYSIEYSGTLWFFYIFARWLPPNSAALRAFAMWMHCDTVVASVEQNTFKLAALTDVKRAQCLCARVRVRCEYDTACVCVFSLWVRSYQFNMSPLPLLSYYYCRIDNLICHLIGVLNLVLFSGYFHTSSIENWTAVGNMAVAPQRLRLLSSRVSCSLLHASTAGGKGILVGQYYK